MLKWGSDAPASAAAKRKRAQRVREADLRESEDPETKRAADAKRARELQEMRKASERRRALGKICIDHDGDIIDKRPR